nr:dystroglycan-like [Penaeus vannamei]
MLRLTLVVAVALACHLPALRAQHLENDLQSLLHDLDVNQDATAPLEMDDDFEVELFYRPEDEAPRASAPKPAKNKVEAARGHPVKRQWGVSDTRAHHGFLFSHPVPRDAFSGRVDHLQVTGLPDWLHWDSAKGVFEGVPLSSDRGPHYITIKAYGSDHSFAKDVFAIEVDEIDGSILADQFDCRPKEDLTVMSVMIETHLPTLEAKGRVKLLRTAVKYFGVKQMWLVPAPHDFDPLAENDAIMAGPGNASLRNTRLHTDSLAQLQWIVGCGGNVAKKEQVNHVEAAARDGTLQNFLSVPVHGWSVTQVHPSFNRVRRQIENSGDYDYNYYDYDYYNYEEEDDGYSYSIYDEPETRVIPSLATPVFTDTPATYYPGVPAEVPISVSPVLRPVPISTPVFVPVKPTRVLEASPTVTYESAYPTEYPDLEGSIVTRPAHTVDSTTPLSATATMTKKPVIAPTRTIEPSSVPTVAVTTEIGVKNFPPLIKNRIQKLAWIAGHVYRLQIPADTFEDIEDGTTRDLRLLFRTSDGQAIGRNSWIQFNPSRQEIYALPLEDKIGRYTFLLEAMDSEGKTITDSIMIHVQQSKEARNFNHRFTATFRVEKKYEYDFVYSLDWKIKVVEKIAQIYGDPDTDNINVRSISENPTKLTWTNTTLTNSRSPVCPEAQLLAVQKVLVEGNEHDLTREVKEAFQPEFHLKRIHPHFMGSCEEDSALKPGMPHPPGPEDTSRGGETFSNSQPIIRNHIDFLNATLGMLFRYQVPTDTCYDLEDGDSRHLNLRLLTSNLSPPPLDSWLQFDEANQEFFGLPLEGDTGKAEYILECVDSGGEKVNDALFIRVKGGSTTKIPPVEFSMTVDTDYQQFMSNAHQKARLIEQIAYAFGDSDTENVVVESLRQGSVEVKWHNGSLPSEPCPNEEIQRLRKIMVNDNGELKREFVENFAPDFKVERGSVRPSGSCLAEDTPTHVEEDVHHPPQGETVQGEENDYLLNFIIPAVIIAAMLLLAAIIACCLYRRRRYGKMTMADDSTFVSKGIPIIFAEELDDRPDPAKSPVIMKDEKPPLPPPEYQRGSSPAASSTPPTSDRRRPPSGDTGDDTPSYQPPPPFTATNGASRHPRPNMPPTYRKPPTYVPP